MLDASLSMSLMLGNSVTSMKTHQFRNDLAIFYAESQLRRVEDKHLTSQKSQFASGMLCYQTFSEVSAIFFFFNLISCIVQIHKESTALRNF